jgi:hypothetical protein
VYSRDGTQELNKRPEPNNRNKLLEPNNREESKDLSEVDNRKAGNKPAFDRDR